MIFHRCRWGLGCAVAEMYLGRPIFPARSDAELLMYITEALGLPDKQTFDSSRFTSILDYFIVNFRVRSP